MFEFETLMKCLPAPPDYRYDWAALKNTPLGLLLDRMNGVCQDPRWHGEGDVLRHTRMVCESLCGMEAFRSLPDEQRNVVALAALLHDVGKIPVTRMEEGKWISPGHSSLGARMARETLWKDFGMCGTAEKLKFRETVCALVRHHMAPVHILDQEKMDARLMQIAADGALTELFGVELLCLLAEADVRGRIADDTQEQLELVEMCRQAAAEANCLRGPAPFADDYTRRAYFRGRNIWPGQALYNDTWGEVVLLCGLPGTGKDTWVSRSGLPMVSLDVLRRQMGISPTDKQGPVAQAAQEQARVFLRAKQPFVWNATNITESLRQKLVCMFEDYGASVRIVYLETDWQENLRRNASRSACVPEGEIERMLGKMSLPRRWEAERVEWQCV